MAIYDCNPSAIGDGDKGTLGLAECHSRSWFREGICLKRIRWRAIEQDT